LTNYSLPCIDKVVYEGIQSPKIDLLDFFFNKSWSSLITDSILFTPESPRATSQHRDAFQTSWLTTIKTPWSSSFMRKAGFEYSVQRNVSLDKNPAPWKKTYVIIWWHQVCQHCLLHNWRCQQSNKMGRCDLGLATDGERQRPSHAYLQLCKEEAVPSWHHPTPVRSTIYSHIRTGWHLKEPSSFDRDCETLLNAVSVVLLCHFWAVLYLAIYFSLPKEMQQVHDVTPVYE